ncbi:MAG TPA: SDR family NAD(P)-dependent oxidoreductase [Candidatus Binatia bacterium]|jgi:NAD(P)-dependent dehydrogenase (short-subunit alcohol dehydrogenase family)
MAEQEIALIVGAGPGLSASLARLFKKEGMKVALAARDAKKLDELVKEIDGRAYPCDASSPNDVENLFDSISKDIGESNLVVYNASARVRGPITELDSEEVRKTVLVTCYGGFLVGQAAAKRMIKAGNGTILFTGASASVKGYANSAAFAMGKFGLTGLVQSMARELQPHNIHVAQVVIDGGICEPTRRPERLTSRGPDGCLDPDAIALTYLQLHRQHRSAWASHIELRPWSEKF